MYKTYIILLLTIMLCFALLNNYIMYKKCYVQYKSNYVLDYIPSDVQYFNYFVFYKSPIIGTELNKIITDYVNNYNKKKCLLYSSNNKQIQLNKGLLYDIEDNLIS